MTRTAPSWLPGTWLPEDKHHPIRPDLPWLRHLTFVEGHAMELGAAFAVFVYLAMSVNQFDVAFPLVAYVARVLTGYKRAKNGSTECDHTLGIHDIAKDPWYFVMVAFAVSIALIGVFGFP